MTSATVAEKTATVTARIGRILEVVGTADARLSLTEIARRVPLPMATAHRLVTELSSWKVLDRDDDKRYGVGRRVFELGVKAAQARPERAVVAARVARLFVETGCQVFVTVPDGDDRMFVIEELHLAGDEPGVALGDRLSGDFVPDLLAPRHPSAVALAHDPRDPRRAIASVPLWRGTSRLYGAISISLMGGEQTPREALEALVRGARELSRDLAS